MKKYFIYALLCMSYLLNATDFKLPDETIIGTASQPADSVEIHKNLESFNRFKKDDMIKYQPYLNHRLITNEEYKSEKVAFIDLSMGNKWNTGLKLAYKDLKNEWLNLNLKVKYQKLSNDWSLYNQQIKWQSANLKWYKLQPQLNMKQHVFNSKDIHTRYNYISADSYFLPFDFFPLSISTGFQYAKQIQRDSSGYTEKKSKYDLLLSSEFELFTIPKFNYRLYQVKCGVLNNLFLFESYSDMFSLKPFLDNTALYISINKNFVPSIEFEKSFHYSEDYTLILKNNPYTSYENSYEQSLSNIHADVRDMGYQLQVPINTSLTMNTFYYIPIHLSTQIEWRKNQAIYAYSQLNQLYDVNWRNAMIASFKANTSVFYKDYRFEYELDIKKSSVNHSKISQIPYMSHLNNSIKIDKRLGHFNHQTEVSLKNLRKDSLNKKMKSAFLVNHFVEYDWKHDFQFYLNTENIFNQKYQKYTYYPKTGITFQLGVNYQF